MAVVASHLFSHPFPQTFDRVQVGTVSWQSHEREAEFGSGLLYAFGAMPRGAVPNDHDFAGPIVQLCSQALQERNRMLFVAGTLVPNEAAALGEVVGAIPVDAVCERR